MFFFFFPCLPCCIIQDRKIFTGLPSPPTQCKTNPPNNNSSPLPFPCLAKRLGNKFLATGCFYSEPSELDLITEADFTPPRNGPINFAQHQIPPSPARPPSSAPPCPRLHGARRREASPPAKTTFTGFFHRKGQRCTELLALYQLCVATRDGADPAQIILGGAGGPWQAGALLSGQKWGLAAPQSFSGFLLFPHQGWHGTGSSQGELFLGSKAATAAPGSRRGCSSAEFRSGSAPGGWGGAEGRSKVCS